jgi:predicted alpha-1,6-mannanase (GH76 family)
MKIARLVSIAICVLLTSGGSGAARRPKTPNYLKQAADGMRTLQKWYSPSTGLYATTGWWNSANAITVLVNYSRVSESARYKSVLSNTFTVAQHTSSGFINKFYDDEGWWALAWIDAYDLTKRPEYLSMAASIFTDMTGGWDTHTCGGGIWWSKDRRYKNAIANELFLSVAAGLANRTGNPAERASYLSWAQKEWNWFHNSGMINAQNLINDGLTSTNPSACVNNGKTTWTYNQGVILGALVALYRADHDATLQPIAKGIASSALLHLTDSKDILHDACEPDCGQDAVQFKGIFVRNLMALDEAFPQPQYRTFVDTNSLSISRHSQGPRHQFGQVWSGPFDKGNAGSQSAALDIFVAAAEMEKNASGNEKTPLPVNSSANSGY